MLWFYAELVVATASTAVGLYVGYQAYRGFRRNDSRPMQLLSVGLLFLTAVTYTLSFGGTLLVFADVLDPSLRKPIVFLARVTQLLGLVCIAYSFYSKPR